MLTKNLYFLGKHGLVTLGLSGFSFLAYRGAIHKPTVGLPSLVSAAGGGGPTITY